MKKFISLFLVCLLLLSLTACGKFDLSRKKLASQKEIEEFVLSKAPSADASADESLSFEYEMTVKTRGEAYDYKIDSKLTLKVKYYSDKDISKTSWKFSKKATYREYYANDSLKGNLKYRESGVSTVKNLIDESYIDVYMRGRNADYSGIREGRINLDYKTDALKDSKASSYLVNCISLYSSVLSNILGGDLDSYLVFIDGDDVTLIDSNSSSHTEIVALFDGKTLTHLRVKEIKTSSESTTETEHVFTFNTVEEGDIKEPKNKDAY